MSWREETPQAVLDDLDTLVENALQTLDGLLVDMPSVLPFGLQIENGGNGALVLPDPDVHGDKPVASEVLDDIVKVLTGRAAELRAVATVLAVEIAGEDAVCVQVEHRDGGPGLMLLRKYRATRAGQPVIWGESQAQVDEKRVWA